jgi:aspartate-semialdehyde dehydrogenase
VLDRGDLAMFVTAVRVPMFFGLALAVTVETEQALAADEATQVLRPARGLLVHASLDDPYPTPVEVTGTDAIHVGRIRTDPSTDDGLACWIALDNVGTGCALNLVQIAELLVRDHL